MVDKPAFLGLDDLKDLCAPGKQLDMQLLAVPWVSRSGLMAYLNFQTRDLGQLYEEIEKRLSRVQCLLSVYFCANMHSTLYRIVSRPDIRFGLFLTLINQIN